MTFLSHQYTPMIEISPTAQTHFRRLLENQGGEALGIRLYAVNGGTPAGDAKLEFAESADLRGDEWSVECEGFTLFVDAASTVYFDGAEIDYLPSATGGSLNIRAPRIKGALPGEDASLWSGYVTCWKRTSTLPSPPTVDGWRWNRSPPMAWWCCASVVAATAAAWSM